MNILDHALAAAALGFKVHPLPPLAKAPPLKGWQELATTDENTILAWWRENPNRNYGILTGADNDLLVVDLDGTDAKTFWDSRGFEPGTVVDTPSGLGHEHIYYRTEAVDIKTSKGELHPHIDVRAEGAYVCGPGSMLRTGTYRGNIASIPMASQAVLDFMPEKQTYTSIIREGEKVDGASESELRQIADQINRLDTLPRVWSEGAGWRTTFFRAACHFSRMVNSPEYALTEGGAFGILMAHMPTDAEWGEPEAHAQWVSAVRTTAGQFADIPAATVAHPNLLPFAEVANLLPEHVLAVDGILFSQPADASPAGLATVRRQILTEAFRAGLDAPQAATVAWSARATAELQSAPGGLSTLWSEVVSVQAAHIAEQGAPTPDERPALGPVAPAEYVSLLSDEERAVFATYNWFGTRYMTWAESRVALMNPPYHRVNVFTILALVFSDAGFIPDPANPIGLNLFSCTAGKSTTGKTEASALMKSVIKACFPKGDGPNIGGNASPNALIEKLIERDGKPSLFITDEAHGLFKQMSGEGSWMAGLKELLADLYGGVVSMILRSGKKDISGAEATTFFTAHLMGTVAGLTDVLEEEMWVSGLLPRFIWAIGADIEPDESTFDARQTDAADDGAETNTAYDAMPKQWAAEFANAKQKLKAFGLLPLPMRHEPDALARQTKLQRDLSKISRGHKHEELLRPTLIRFGINVRKCAVLIAMSEGAGTVTLRHELIAIEAAEEWLQNILFMVSATTASAFNRSVDKIEQFIAGRPGSEARPEAIHRFSKDSKRYTDEYLDQLRAEGRITKNLIKNTDAYTWRINERSAA